VESLTAVVELAAAGCAEELADVAAQTFPLGCPARVDPVDVAAFIDGNLSAARFAEYLADPRRAVLTARRDGRIVGYAMLIRESADDTAELSKMYVLADCHGTGVAGAPKFGDKAVWAPIIAQGTGVLYDRAIHGYTGKRGVMPPKGGSTASDDDVKAAVDYIVANSK